MLEKEAPETVDSPEGMKAKSDRFSWVQPLKKALVLFAVLLGGLLLVYHSPLKSYLGIVREMSATLNRIGMAAPLFYMLGVSTLVAFGFPRLFLCPIGGMAFGFFWGVIWSQTGALIGSYLQFVFFSWGGRAAALQRNKSVLNFLTQLFKKRGIPAIFLIRQLPITGIIQNFFFALMRVSHFDYLVGTALGYLPEAIPATLIGTGIMQHTFKKSFSYITGSIILLMVIWVLTGLYARSANSKITETGSP
jgi:uncharacterized membrane protein YdjX (TVP38/TMEM64 family)